MCVFMESALGDHITLYQICELLTRNIFTVCSKEGYAAYYRVTVSSHPDKQYINSLLPEVMMKL